MVDIDRLFHAYKCMFEHFIRAVQITDIGEVKFPRVYTFIGGSTEIIKFVQTYSPYIFK